MSTFASRLEMEPSDIGDVWEQALDKYYRDTGINVKSLPQTTWNISTMKNDQERQVTEFSKWRHNKGVVDKFRSAISRNSDIIQAVAKNVANAASTVRAFISLYLVVQFNNC